MKGNLALYLNRPFPWKELGFLIVPPVEYQNAIRSDPNIHAKLEQLEHPFELSPLVRLDEWTVVDEKLVPKEFKSRANQERVDSMLDLIAVHREKLSESVDQQKQDRLEIEQQKLILLKHGKHIDALFTELELIGKNFSHFQQEADLQGKSVQRDLKRVFSHFDRFKQKQTKVLQTLIDCDASNHSDSPESEWIEPVEWFEQLQRNAQAQPVKQVDQEQPKSTDRASEVCVRCLKKAKYHVKLVDKDNVPTCYACYGWHKRHPRATLQDLMNRRLHGQLPKRQKVETRSGRAGKVSLKLVD